MPIKTYGLDNGPYMDHDSVAISNISRSNKYTEIVSVGPSTDAEQLGVSTVRG